MKKFDISAYFVIGPENIRTMPFESVLRDVLEAGFTCIQIRSKVASDKEMIEMTCLASKVIAQMGKSEDVTLLVDDRLDVVLAARYQGAKVDGIHVGQSDIPVEVCRAVMGEAAIIGLSARTADLLSYVQTVSLSEVDYFGTGPLFETPTKPDCGLDPDGKVRPRTYTELKLLAKISPLPVVVGGGVKLEHLPELAKTGVQGFFVVSAVTDAPVPKVAAEHLVKTWRHHAIQNNKGGMDESCSNNSGQ